MMRFLLVCLGGAIGTAARYLTAIWVPTLLGTSFPYGTLIVNGVGSFLIAFIMHVGGTTEILSPNARAMLTTGVMGGFTTYSTFNYETSEYLRQGAWLMATANVLLTVAICLAAGFAGLAIARMILGR
ncbi:MAG TPA: fluoride efflux transporter CrcB [Thermoanaerobaculia bacterium]|nr:fluoride efflux transporter CrcB [Thermoanaerobaculia bacterium]